MTDEDLARAKALPQCECCMKQSDGAKRVYDDEGRPHVLCGTDFQAWLGSHERNRTLNCPGGFSRNFMDFLARRRAEAANGCGVPA